MDGDEPRLSGEKATVRVLATTDLHATIRSYDYGLRRADPSRGLSRVASLARSLRAGAHCSLLIDNGDFLFGESNSAVADCGIDGVIAAMNAAGYDAAALGNHEFDHGAEPVRQAMRMARFPILCANLTETDGRPFAVSHTVVTRRITAGAELRVGLVGFLPDSSVGAAGQPKLDGLRVGDVMSAFDRVIEEVRGEGADIVVALCHAGLRMDSDETAVALARSGAIDALILGHTHDLFPGPNFVTTGPIDVTRGELCGVPAILPAFWGRYLGRIDLHLERTASGWRPAGHEVALHPVAQRSRTGRIEASVPSDRAVLRASLDWHRTALRRGQRIVGRLDRPLSTYFSRLGRCAATATIARAKRNAVERRLRDGPLVDLPVVGLAATRWCGGRAGPHHYIDVPAGPLREADLRRLCPFPDRIVGIPASGADLRRWLERSVSALARIRPGESGGTLVDERFPAMHFDLPDAVRFAVDLAAPPLFDVDGTRLRDGPGRVLDLRLEGRALDDDAPLVLAVTEYRLHGGGGFPVPMREPLIRTGETALDALQRLLAEKREIPSGHIFDFAPVAGASALYRTGPGAARHAAIIEALALQPVGTGTGGFDTYRLDLDRLP